MATFRRFVWPALVLTFAASAFGRVNRSATAGEWPQILGPNRDGVVENERLADHWPMQGPAEVWRQKVGSGYAGPIVTHEADPGTRLRNRLIVYHRLEDQTIAEALDAATGRSLWRAEFPTSYTSGIAPDNGPRATPLAIGDALILYSAEGDVRCLTLATGKQRWARRLGAELSAPPGYFGFGSTPIVVDGRVLVNVGGPRGAGIVALSLADGATLWQKTDEAASYSSPVVTKIDGHQRAIFITRLDVLSLDPANGALGFRLPFGARGPTVNAATPVVLGDHLFITASYGVGARLLKLKGDQAEVVWSDDTVLSSQFATPVAYRGVLYGIDGRQDAGVARLRAIDPLTKRVLWTQEEFGMANLILADGKLLALKVDGTLVMIDPKTDGYHELATAKLFDGVTQPLAALCDGFLHARDADTLKCFDLRASKR